jgi:DNA-binding transcriptional ArsR family regulator/rhodanese-related sulfurtransferase
MTPIREIKDALNEQFAKIGHALSSPKRLELLELLNQCEKSVETLSSNTGMSIANTSRHLQVLRGAGLVESRREGNHIYYRLADDRVSALVGNLKHVAEARLGDIDRVLSSIETEPEQLENVDRRALMKLMHAGKITVLDVRPEDEYRAAHISEAISIPLDQLKNHLSKLPRDQKIVAYCRGPYCILASEAVRQLRSKGFQATRLGDGIAEWKAAGMPVATS